MSTRRLGTEGCEVSALSLGSWRTFERIGRDEGLAVMRAARDAGITLLDDARYDDETGTAPIKTGYSEIVFGELFRGAGWRRTDTIIANKLWWEFWPRQSPAEELDESLRRMEMDYLDIIYTAMPPEGLGLDEFLGSIGALIESGKARYWGVLNWPAATVIEAARLSAAQGMPPMVAHQLPYSLVYRSPVEDEDMQAALAASGSSVVASYALAGGLLSGKYEADPGAGRAAGTLGHPRTRAALVAARELVALAGALDTDAATLAIAFALLYPTVGTVLFGATRPEQVRRNVRALDLVNELDDDAIVRLRAIGVP